MVARSKNGCKALTGKSDSITTGGAEAFPAVMVLSGHLHCELNASIRNCGSIYEPSLQLVICSLSTKSRGTKLVTEFINRRI